MTANVKIRDGLMDIKVLREVDGAGLERWEPVMKQGFPMSAEDAGRVLEALGISAPPQMRPAYELDGFLEELVRPSGAVREAKIEKRRTRFQVNGCMAELTEVIAGGRSTRSVADRVRGCFCGRPGRPRPRPRRVREHELPTRAQGAPG